MVFFLQEPAGFSKGRGVFQHLRVNCGQLDAIIAEGAVLRFDKNCPLFRTFTAFDIQGTQPNFDDLAGLTRRWVPLPAGRFKVNHDDFIKQFRHFLPSHSS